MDNLPRRRTLRAPGTGRTVAMMGDIYRFLATGEDTDGKFATWDALVPPGGGPPPHAHSREEESFFVLEGEIAIRTGGERIVLTPGMFASMPVGIEHSFKNETDRPARMLITVAPAGLEEFFFKLGTPLEPTATVAPPPSPADIEKLIEIAPRFGIALSPPKH